MKKVLIVDDEQNIINSLKRVLRKRGVEIITHTNFHEAKFEITRQMFDLTFLDLKLENTIKRNSGLELLLDIRKYSPQTKVIIMTGFGSKEIEKTAYDNGAYLYIEKPFNHELLNKCLDELGI